MDGGGAVGTFLRLFGPSGLKLTVVGLCDEDQESRWLSELQKAGFSAMDRTSMSSAGFFVCVKDLEQEFVRAIGLTATQSLIANEGQSPAFSAFQKQQAHSGAALDEQLRRFLQKDKVGWTIPLVDALNLKAIPGPLSDILAKL
jgi:hypothetical protein